jgi:hypothetical protein
VIAAVGGVKVDEHVRLPRGKHRERRSSLRRLGLDVVAIEVERVRVRPLSNERRAVLGRPVALLRSDALVAVGVVDRHRDEDDRVEDVVLLLKEEVAQ